MQKISEKIIFHLPKGGIAPSPPLAPSLLVRFLEMMVQNQCNDSITLTNTSPVQIALPCSFELEPHDTRNNAPCNHEHNYANK